MCTLIRLQPMKPHYPSLAGDRFYELIDEEEHYYTVRDGLVGAMLHAEKTIWFVSEVVRFEYGLKRPPGGKDMRIRIQRLPADVEKSKYEARYVEIDAVSPRPIWRRITPEMATAFKSFLKSGFYRRNKRGITIEVRMAENFKVMATEHELRRRSEKEKKRLSKSKKSKKKSS